MVFLTISIILSKHSRSSIWKHTCDSFSDPFQRGGSLVHVKKVCGYFHLTMVAFGQRLFVVFLCWFLLLISGYVVIVLFIFGLFYRASCRMSNRKNRQKGAKVGQLIEKIMSPSSLLFSFSKCGWSVSSMVETTSQKFTRNLESKN